MLTPTFEKYELARELIEKTNKHVFLTGKAGTGKTTFLHQLRNRTFKRHIVLAPTGVAAINAHGVTIHSFFQLPLRPLLPDELNERVVKEKKLFRFNSKKQNIIRTLDLLIIDEISMVRADVLDAIDYALRSIRKTNQPFGNVQLLMIGDLYQLAPVIKNDEWQMLNHYYNSPYFFESHALRQSQYVTIELEKVFRQENEDFVRILNKIREGEIDEDVYETLHTRYVPHFDENKYKNYILLTTHNNKANHINQSKLDEIASEAKVYEATIKGEFPAEIFPTDALLTLKIGAQVMFLRNDTSENKKYYNGKIGKVVELGDTYIKVQSADDDEIIDVEPATWENIRYSIDPETKTIKEEIIGLFVQYPLKLAWAITIHKSQGLTFEKVAIDAQQAFAHGQVYVALSRCRSLEGLILLSKINLSSVKVNPYLQQYSSSQSSPTYADVLQAQKDFLFQQVIELFDFSEVETTWQHLIDILRSITETSVIASLLELEALQLTFKDNIADVSKKFQAEVLQYQSTTQATQPPDAFQERIKKAVSYFNDQLTQIIEKLMKIKLNVAEDLKSEKRVDKIQKNLLSSMAQKKFFLLSAKDGFYQEKYWQAKANAHLNVKQMLAHIHKKEEKSSLHKHTSYPQLYNKLKAWRKLKAAETQMEEEAIVSSEILVKLALKSPLTEEEVSRYLGSSLHEVAKWKKEITEIISQFVQQNKKSSRLL